MPYIRKAARKELEPPVAYYEGDLNYLITRACMLYLDSKPECYDAYNEVIGVLECVKLELYRRKISQYEDKKIQENGDV